VIEFIHAVLDPVSLVTTSPLVWPDWGQVWRYACCRAPGIARSGNIVHRTRHLVTRQEVAVVKNVWGFFLFVYLGVG
jgi:hypothetical protein